MATRWVKNLILLFFIIYITVGICRPKFFSPEDREKAIAMDEISDPKLKKFFTPSNDFEPLPAPKPGDWLAVHPEPGQSFQAYRASWMTNKFAPPRNKLYLRPIGKFDNDSPSIEALQKLAQAFFQAETVVQSPVGLEKHSFTSRINSYTKKNQLLTTDILDFLGKDVAKDAYCVQAVTMEDLYPEPSWNFVFGQATLQNRVGVFSFARYNPEFYGKTRDKDFRELMFRRAGKVMLHEMGHMFGIYHCVFYNCLMNGSNHLAESDRRPMTLCPVCLRKLHHQIKFDLTKRYKDLEKCFRENRLTKEADWVAARLNRL